VIIEGVGATTLAQVGGSYYLYANGTSSGPPLEFNGTPVVAGQYGGYTPIGAEQTASGYIVAFEDAGSNQFSVWSTDSNGKLPVEHHRYRTGNEHQSRNDRDVFPSGSERRRRDWCSSGIRAVVDD